MELVQLVLWCPRLHFQVVFDVPMSFSLKFGCAAKLDEMTFKGPFPRKPFYDSMKSCLLSIDPLGEAVLEQILERTGGNTTLPIRLLPMHFHHPIEEPGVGYIGGLAAAREAFQISQKDLCWVQTPGIPREWNQPKLAGAACPFPVLALSFIQQAKWFCRQCISCCKVCLAVLCLISPYDK